MRLEEMRRRKRELRLTTKELAFLSGVPISTIGKILCGATTRPRSDTVRALEKALGMTAESRKNSGDDQSVHADANTNAAVGSRAESGMPRVKTQAKTQAGAGEACQLYGYSVVMEDVEREIVSNDGILEKMPQHTAEEYLANTDSCRMELIGGRFYEMPAPDGLHQQIAMRICCQLMQNLEDRELPWTVQTFPFHARLDDLTVVQPDIMVFSTDPGQAFSERAGERPDLVVEVLSRSTAFKDRYQKLYKYRAAGVREVWLVSPLNKKVQVYLWGDGKEDPETWTFADEVPVGISGRQVSVDFAGICRQMTVNGSED
jgi:Uma2 family endonuclease